MRRWSFAFDDFRGQFVDCLRVTGIFLVRKLFDCFLELGERDLAPSAMHKTHRNVVRGDLTVNCTVR